MQMMDIYKLATDIVLMGSLIAVAMRLLRAPAGGGIQSRQGVELEAALRGLVKDADTQSKALSEELRRREQALQRLLTEIQEAESRASEAAAAARDVRQSLDTQIPKAVQAADEIARSLSLLKSELAAESGAEPRAPRGEPQAAPPEARTASHAAAAARFEPFELELEVEAEPEPPGFEVVVLRQSAAKPLADWSLAEHRAKATPEAAATPARHGSDTDAMADLYSAAEELLKAGGEISMVSQRTTLPLDEVRKLSLMVEKERVFESSIGEGGQPETSERVIVADPRLGVLGKGRQAPVVS